MVSGGSGMRTSFARAPWPLSVEILDRQMGEARRRVLRETRKRRVEGALPAERMRSPSRSIVSIGELGMVDILS